MRDVSDDAMDNRSDGRNSLPRHLVGRMAAALTALGAIATLTAESAIGQLDADSVASSSAAVIAGVILWSLPWDRWGHRGTITFFFLSLLSLFLGVIFEPKRLHPLMVPILLVTLFAWNGFAHDRWMSLKLSPLGFAAYAGPGIINPSHLPDLFSLVLVMPVSVMIGEAISWVAARLTTAEAEQLLNRHRADFLTAAQHEIRTPVTSIAGSLKVLRDRGDELSSEDRKLLIEGILNATDRLTRFAEGLADVDGGGDRKPREDDGLGLLSAHFDENKDIRLDDPARGNLDS